MLFNSRLPVKTYTASIADMFSQSAQYFYSDLERNKQSSGAIYTQNPNSPSGYERMLLSSCPPWYSDFYWQHTSMVQYRSPVTGRLKKAPCGSIERGRVLKGLDRIAKQSDWKNALLQSKIRQMIYDHLVDEVRDELFRAYFQVPYEQLELDFDAYSYPQVSLKNDLNVPLLEGRVIECADDEIPF